MKNPFRRKHKKVRTKRELDIIAGLGKGRSGIFSWRTVHDAYIRAGLSKEAATRETNARVVVID